MVKIAKLHSLGLAWAAPLWCTLLAKSFPKQVKQWLEDCGYSSISGELAYQLNDLFSLPKFHYLYH